jgi:hypothetical protein
MSCYHIRESFGANGRIINKRVFFDMPIQCPEGRDDILPHKRIIFCVRCNLQLQF